MSIRLPRVVVHLGRLIEIKFVDGDTWKPRRSVQLCCSESGRTLWVLETSREVSTKQPKNKLYEAFHGYLTSGVRTAKVREPSKLQASGKVVHVVYSSNKWDSKTREYIHVFRSHPTAYCDNRNKPTFVKISGSRIRVKSAGITG